MIIIPLEDKNNLHLYKEDDKGVVYELVSPSGKRYIGSTIKSFKYRLSQHYSNLRSDNHPNYILQAAYDKYGEFKTNILEKVNFTNVKELRLREQYYIDLLKPEYNIAKDVLNPFISSKHYINLNDYHYTNLDIDKPYKSIKNIPKYSFNPFVNNLWYIEKYLVKTDKEKEQIKNLIILYKEFKCQT